MQNTLFALPALHLISAFLVLILFIGRGIGAILEHPMTNARWVVNSYIIATLLLFISGIVLALLFRIPFSSAYIISLIIGLIFFISSGLFAFNQHYGKGVTIVAWLFGIVCFSLTWLISTYQIELF